MLVEPAKRIAAYVCAAYCGWQIWNVMVSVYQKGFGIGHAFLLLALGALCVGLALRATWARKATSALLLVFAVFLPIGAFGPFAALDVADAGGPYESTLELVIRLVLTETALLVLVWLLDPRSKGQPNHSLKPDGPDGPPA